MPEASGFGQSHKSEPLFSVVEIYVLACRDFWLMRTYAILGFLNSASSSTTGVMLTSSGRSFPSRT